MISISNSAFHPLIFSYFMDLFSLIHNPELKFKINEPKAFNKS
jgi:hypothetical protein